MLIDISLFFRSKDIKFDRELNVALMDMGMTVESDVDRNVSHFSLKGPVNFFSINFYFNPMEP